MLYLSHLASHVPRFGPIEMYSAEIGELAHKETMKEGYRGPNKNEASCQMLSHYGRWHALGMRFQTLETLLKVESVIMIDNTGEEVVAASRRIPHRLLKGRIRNIGRLPEL